MAKIAVLASGSGSNFQKIAEALSQTLHQISVLIYDRKDAFARERAQKLGIPSVYVPYAGRTKDEAEKAIQGVLEDFQPDLVVLAGFMRVLSPAFVRAWEGRIVNIHPTLLPRHPGAHGIKDSFDSGDALLGVTVHRVDEGVDTGEILEQMSFSRSPGETLESAEEKIHELEYQLYPKVILSLCNALEQKQESSQ